MAYELTKTEVIEAAAAFFSEYRGENVSYEEWLFRCTEAISE